MAKLLLGCHLSTQFRLCHFRSPTFSICNPPHLILLSSPPGPRHHRLHILRSRHWNSNAETFDFDAEDELAAERWDELLDDYIDSIWIFKVFKSFGWMLPPIIISMLFTTGPKAFLLALALPIGQSTFAFAIQRFQNRDKIKRKPITRTKANRGRPRRNYRSRKVKFKGAAAEPNATKEVIKKKKGFQSWASENNVSVSNSGRSASDFGGWDELDEVVMESNVKSMKKGGENASGFERASREKGITGKRSAKDGPLLLRLLISAFPFLNSLVEILL